MNLYVRLRLIHDSRNWCKWKCHPFPCKPTYLWFKGLPEEWTQKLMWVLDHFLCWRNVIGFVYEDFFSVAGHHVMGQGLLIVEASRSLSDTPHSLELLWTSDQPVAHTSTWQHTTQHTDFRAPARFEPTVPVSERPQSHAIDHADTGMLPGHIAIYPLLPHTCWTGIWCHLAVLLVTPEVLPNIFVTVTLRRKQHHYVQLWRVCYGGVHWVLFFRQIQTLCLGTQIVT